MAIKGIDVSKYQGKIDWPAVKADGVEFAIIRCGYANSDGSITKDPCYETNMTGAIAAGIHVGVYVYSYVSTVAAARVAARNVLRMVQGYKVTYPLMWDYENAKISVKLTKAQNSAVCKAALSEWEVAGWYAMLYTYKSFTESYLDMDALAAYDFWLAHYTSKTSYKGAYGIWQYTSSGRVGGIAGRVDMNWAYKDYPAIIANACLNKQAAPAKRYVVRTGKVSDGDAKKLYAVLKAEADKLGNISVEKVEV